MNVAPVNLSPYHSISLFTVAALLAILPTCINCKALGTFECIVPDMYD